MRIGIIVLLLSFSHLLSAAELSATLTISDGAVYNFGEVKVQEIASKTFTLTNVGDAPATNITGTGISAPISSFFFSGGAFPGVTGTCTDTLEAGATCTFEVEFYPTEASTFVDTIDIYYFDGVSDQSTTRDIYGVGVE